MTVYNFTQVLVWDNLGGSVKVARNQRVNVTDPSTGAVAPGLTVNGQPVSFVTSDSNGHVSFAATIGTVTLTGPNGFSMNFQSPDAYVQATQAAADAKSSADSAAASAKSAQDSANLVGAPAGAAVDTRLGSGVGLSVAATASVADVQAALDDAAANGKRAVAYGTITTSTTLVIKSDCDLSQLTVNYTGTGTAVQVGNGASGNSGILFRKDIKLPTIVNANKASTGWAAGLVGVQAINTYGCTIRVSRISGFETGYYAYGLGTGNVYNDVFLSHLDNNKRNLVLGAGTGGWSNSNTYRLGLLTHNSGEGANVAGARQILVETATNLVNANLFIGGSVEGNVAEYHLDCDGLYNRFVELRWENTAGGGCRVRWGANAARNVIDYGYNAQTIVETRVAGATLNRLYTTGMSRITGSTNKAINVYENTSSSAAGVDAIMDPGATAASADPATAYRVFRTADSTKMKRASDADSRMTLDHTNGRVYFGDGTAAPTVFFGWDSAGLLKINAASLYPATHNTNDLGINANRWRYARLGTGVVVGAFATASRPNAATGGIGTMIFDSTLNKPIWSDGTNWRDATGTIV